MESSLRARSAIGVGALLLAGLLAGCKDEEHPTTAVEPPVVPAPHHSSSPSGVPAAKGREVAPVATVRAWISAYNQALSTGDTSAAHALTGRRCASCDELLTMVEAVHRHGGFFRGGRWTIDAARITQRASHSATVTAGISEAPGTTKASNAAEPDAYPLQRFILEFEVTRVADTSVVTTIVFLS